MSKKKILECIKKHKSFLVATHVNPDPDALSSQLAVGNFLRSIGKKAYMINEKPILDRLNLLPEVEKIKNLTDDLKNVHFEVVIVVDCGEFDRIGEIKKLITKNHIIINIDHHITNDNFGHINLVDPKASSTAEVLFEFLKSIHFKFNRALATNLYSGLMTDTGSFRFENTTSKSHQMAAELLAQKIDVHDMYRKFYECIPLNDLLLFAKLISKVQVFSNEQVLIIELTKNITAQFSEHFDLRDTIFKFLRSAKEVEVVVILTEDERNKTRVNFRSTGKINVATLASHFKGGGHKRASGCVISKNLKASKQVVLQEIKSQL